jgi:hypothetical protein
MVDQIDDLFLTTHTVKTQQVIKSRGQSDPVSLVLDLRITRDRSLNEDTDDKIRKYHADYNNNPPNTVSFMTAVAPSSGRLHSEFVRLLFLQAHRETDRFFAASGVQLAQSDRVHFHFRLTAFDQQLKIRVDLVIAKAAPLRITLILDGVPIISKSHTHPSHLQTYRLFTSSLSLGVPVPRVTQCIRVM